MSSSSSSSDSSNSYNLLKFILDNCIYTSFPDDVLKFVCEGCDKIAIVDVRLGERRHCLGCSKFYCGQCANDLFYGNYCDVCSEQKEQGKS